MNSECIGWVWYLANDFQFFMITPPILYVFCKNRKVGYCILGFLLFASMLFNGIIAGVYNISINLQTEEINSQDLLYCKP